MKFSTSAKSVAVAAAMLLAAQASALQLESPSHTLVNRIEPERVALEKTPKDASENVASKFSEPVQVAWSIACMELSHSQVEWQMLGCN